MRAKTNETCTWCGRRGCRDHEAERSFPLGTPEFLAVGPPPPDDYVQRREALIPLAEALADEATGTKPGNGVDHSAWAAAWSRAFHAAMEHLWRELEQK